MSIDDDDGFTGGSCTYNTTTGIPDENCYFVPDPSANVSRWFIEPWIIIVNIKGPSCCFSIEIFTLLKTSVRTWQCPSLMLWPTSVMIQRNTFTTRVSCSTFVTKSEIQWLCSNFQDCLQSITLSVVSAVFGASSSTSYSLWISISSVLCLFNFWQCVPPWFSNVWSWHSTLQGKSWLLWWR